MIYILRAVKKLPGRQGQSLGDGDASLSPFNDTSHRFKVRKSRPLLAI